MSHRVEITGGGPPSPSLTRRIIVEEAEAGLTRIGQNLHREVLSRMARHRRTGHLMRSVFARVASVQRVLVLYVGATVFYAMYLERGTGLYGPRNRWITPLRARALRWPDRGGGGFTLAGRRRSGSAGAQARYIFARRVRGIRPLRFFRDSHIVTEPINLRIAEQHASRAAARLEAAWTSGGA